MCACGTLGVSATMHCQMASKWGTRNASVRLVIDARDIARGDLNLPGTYFFREIYGAAGIRASGLNALLGGNNGRIRLAT